MRPTPLTAGKPAKQHCVTMQIEPRRCSAHPKSDHISATTHGGGPSDQGDMNVFFAFSALSQLSHCIGCSPDARSDCEDRVASRRVLSERLDGTVDGGKHLMLVLWIRSHWYDGRRGRWTSSRICDVSSFMVPCWTLRHSDHVWLRPAKLGCGHPELRTSKRGKGM